MEGYKSNWIERNHYYRLKSESTKELPHYEEYARPIIVVLCGSCRFKDAFIQAQQEETLKGNIVLSVGMFIPVNEQELKPEVKAMLDQLHFRKIELADEVLILNVGGYIGHSTSNELAHARKLCKTVRFLEPQKKVV